MARRVMKTAAVLGAFVALAFPVTAGADPEPNFACTPGTYNMMFYGMGGVAQDPVWAAYDASDGHSNGGPTLDQLQAAYIASCGYPE